MALFLLSLCVAILGAQALTSCPERTAKSDFDISRFVGVWHDVKSVPLHRHQNMKCLHNIASQREDGGLTLTAMYYNTTSSEYNSFTRDFNRDAGATSGRFTIDSGEGSGSVFTVLDTDYTSYSVLSFCLKRGDSYHERVWVAAPTETLSSEAETAASSSLPAGDYEPSDQTDCPEHDHHAHH